MQINFLKQCTSLPLSSMWNHWKSQWILRSRRQRPSQLLIFYFIRIRKWPNCLQSSRPVSSSFYSTFNSLLSYLKKLHWPLYSNTLLKGTLTWKNCAIKDELLCKIKFCISHKTDDSVFWNKLFDDKSHQVCLHGGGSTAITIVITGNSRYVYFYLWFVVC